MSDVSRYLQQAVEARLPQKGGHAAEQRPYRETQQAVEAR